MKIGVLALQGAFREHLDDARRDRRRGRRACALPADLDGVSGLILPGGESTTMRQLIDRWGLREPILDLAATRGAALRDVRRDDRPGREIAGGEAPILPLLDVTVERNAFGRQLDSFEAELQVPVLGDTPVHAVFIRAPIIERTGPDVDVLARLDDGRIVAVRERNVIATAFHPELAGETRFHRLVATMAAEHDDPGEGSGRRPPPDPPVADGRHDRGTRARSERRAAGKVRAARLTDLAALGELSRLCQADERGDALARPAGQRPADRRVQPVPPAARRVPAARPDVRLRGGRPPRRPVRVERESVRDEWTIVELDADRHRPTPATSATGSSSSSCARARSAAPARFHVACADADGNVELFMQAGFMRYGEERILYRAGDQAAARAVDRRAGAATAGIRPAGPLDALPLLAAVRRGDAAPVAAARGASGWPTGSARARTGGSRARSLAPILRFADVEAFVQATAGRRQGRDRSSTASSRSASPRRTSRTTSRSSPGPRSTSPTSSDFGLGVIAARTTKGGDHRHDHGVIAPVRTYESPIDRRLEEAGFDSIASVTLLMKETLVRVAEPALVPAGVR